MASLPASRLAKTWDRLSDEYWAARDKVCGLKSDPQPGTPGYHARCSRWADAILLDHVDAEKDVAFSVEFNERLTLPCSGGCSPTTFYNRGCDDSPGSPLSSHVRHCFERLVPPHVAKLTLKETCNYPAVSETASHTNGHMVLSAALRQWPGSMAEAQSSPSPPGSCFQKSTSMACRLPSLESAAAAAAYEQCYVSGHRSERGPRATLVRMIDLEAGDVVLTRSGDGRFIGTRVIVNQHAQLDMFSEMLTVHTADGTSISLTPDHAIFINGKLAAARDITLGSALSDARGAFVKVTRITHSKSRAAVINPVTSSGTILASDEGTPVLATSHPIWIALFVLETSFGRMLVNGGLWYVGDVVSVVDGVSRATAKLATTSVIAFAMWHLRQRSNPCARFLA